MMRPNEAVHKAVTAISKLNGVRILKFSSVRWMAAMLLSLCPELARAQAPAAVSPGPTVQEGTPASMAPAPSNTSAMPSEPAVNDPMLTPPPRPQRELADWNEAAVELRARSISLATAYAEVTKAEAQSRIALAALLPSINATATATHQFITNKVTSSQGGNGTPVDKTLTTPSSDYINGNITLVQDLIDAKAWHDLGTARAAEVVQRLGVENVKRTMILSLATSMVAVVTAERVAEINRIGLRSALELLSLTNRKRALGAATGLDTVRAEQNVEQSRSAIVSGDESLRQAREALGLALGESRQVAVTSALKLDGVLQSIGQSCHPLNNTLERPELAAARQQLVVTERNIRSVELSFLPTLKAQSTVSSSTLDPGAAPRTTWNIQAVLSVPIWDGGVRYGSLRSARATRDEAGYTIESNSEVYYD